MAQPAAQPFLDPEFYRRYRRYYTYIEPVITDPLVRGYFTLVASMFLVAFFLIAALSPTITTILGLFKKIDDQKKTLVMMDTKISNLVVAQDNFGQIEERLPLLTTAIPETPIPQGIMADVIKTASQSGVILKSLQFEEVSLAGEDNTSSSAEAGATKKFLDLGTPTVQFSVSVTGVSPAVQAFIQSLENLPRVIRLRMLSVSLPNGPTGIIGVDVAGISYYYAKK